MRRTLALGTAAFVWASFAGAPAWGWGADGHSIVAEIAQRRLNRHAAHGVERLLGRGHSLASVASWADDVREARPYSALWHYVDIPVAVDTYDPARDCALTAGGDCVLAELARLKHDINCAPTGVERAEALRFAVHFIGDLHQPLHTLLEQRGGNDVQVTMLMRGITSTREPQPQPSNLHSVWDTGLIQKTVWDWGAYTDRLENGWLKSEEAAHAHGGGPLEWALDSHTQAQRIWGMTPEDHVLNDAYYQQAQLIVDRQLGLGGIHLADYLNDAFAQRCESDPWRFAPWNWWR